MTRSARTQDWRDYRPAIWLTMVGVAVMVLVSPPYIGAFFFGLALGAVIRIRQRRRRAAAEAMRSGGGGRSGGRPGSGRR